jgi:cell wall assembly regulator SMI1
MSAASDIEQTWARIEHVLTVRHPDAHALLRGPAGEQRIARAETKLGVRLPEAFRASVARHDGQDDDASPLIAWGPLLPLAGVVDAWSSWVDLQESGDFDGWMDDEWVRPDPAVRGDRWWRRGWIPFAGADGDHLVLDMDPAESGTVGQVFAFSHETGPGRLAAPGFAEWLAVYAQELEEGLIDLDRGEPGDERDEPKLRTWPE